MAATTIDDHETEISPWLTVREGARRAKCSPRVIYRAVQLGKLRASRLTARREYRIHREWIDAWIAASATEINPHAPGPRVFPPTLRG